jgi:hypothetical protein
VLERNRIPWAIAVIAALCVIVAHTAAVWDSSSPVYWEDEIGYLSNSLVLAGGTPPDLGGKSYYIGWSLVLTPIWWFTTDPAVVYRVASALSALAGILLVVPLTLIARRLGVRLPWAIVLASIVAVSPSRVVMSNFALSENFLTLVIAFTALAAFRFQAHQTLARAATLGALSSLVFITHARASAVLIATLLWLLFRIRQTPAASSIGLAVAIVPSVLGFLLYRHVGELMYTSGSVRESNAIDRLINVDVPSLLAAASGQSWYSAVSWFGIAVIGLVVLTVRVVAEVRTRRFSIGFWGIAVVVGSVFISAGFIAKSIATHADRIDIFSYGRYLDPIVAVIALIGLVAVWRGASRRFAIAAAGLLCVLSVVQLAVLAPLVTTDAGRWWTPISNAGLLQYPWPGVSSATQPPFALATLGALLVLTVIIVVRRSRALVAIGLVVIMGASSAAAEVRTIRPFFDHTYSSFTLRYVLDDYKDQPISFDLDGFDGSPTVSRNAYQFWLAGERVPLFHSEIDAAPTQLVISRKNWDRAVSLGALRIAVDAPDLDNALWVLPGALQDQLLDAGVISK